MRWIAWFAFVATIPSVTAAQRPKPAESLRVGTVELSLGMPQQPALDALKLQFHLERARSAGDDWALIERGQTIAVVSFSAGKLSRVSKTWMTSSERDATTLSDRLYSLAEEFTRQGRTECTLAAKPYALGELKGRIVTLACGNKSIQLIQSRTQRGPSVNSLQEVLQ